MEIIDESVKEKFGSWKKFEIAETGKQTSNLKRKIIFNFNKLNTILSKIGLYIEIKKMR